MVAVVEGGAVMAGHGEGAGAALVGPTAEGAAVGGEVGITGAAVEEEEELVVVEEKEEMEGEKGSASIVGRKGILLGIVQMLKIELIVDLGIWIWCCFV